jgi:hypothetical protein
MACKKVYIFVKNVRGKHEALMSLPCYRKFLFLVCDKPGLNDLLQLLFVVFGTSCVRPLSPTSKVKVK